MNEKSISRVYLSALTRIPNSTVAWKKIAGEISYCKTLDNNVIPLMAIIPLDSAVKNWKHMYVCR